MDPVDPHASPETPFSQEKIQGMVDHVDDLTKDPLEDTPEEELIDHEYCRTLVCPYCGYEHRDPDDITGDDEDGSTDCGRCEKPLRWHRHIEISYSTEKMSTQ